MSFSECPLEPTEAFSLSAALEEICSSLTCLLLDSDVLETFAADLVVLRVGADVDRCGGSSWGNRDGGGGCLGPRGAVGTETGPRVSGDLELERIKKDAWRAGQIWKHRAP